MRESAFKIYNASAGSGKTFTLVKEYLKILLSSDHTQKFHQILAVTFTNKAVNEMKQRILDGLAELSQCGEAEIESDLVQILLDELNIDRNTLKNRAGLQLKRILHNYALFDVSTIDKFTHRVIRTFARDLSISQNFEVVLDTDILLDEAVNNLLAKAGEDKDLTKTLIEFALEKTDEDKSWDLKYDLLKVGKMLFQENEIKHINALKDLGLDNFRALQEQLIREIIAIEKESSSKASAILELIRDTGLSEEDFPRKTLPDHFKKICSGVHDTDLLYKNTLEAQLKENRFLKSTVGQPTAELQSQLLQAYLKIRGLLYRRAYLINVRQNLLPLSVINSIYHELRAIESDKDLLPISSFNTIISSAIIGQPAPFIYERLGEKYRHYFIDEFQDTSEMQWNNLIPLVANALESLDESGNPGSLMLVGDAKQSIYRWRGGKPEQFLNLISLKENPFVVDPIVQSLDTNFRSAEQIIKFNNAFFNLTSPFLASPDYHRLFSEETDQNLNPKRGGFVQLEFIDCEKEQQDETYLDRVKHAIEVVKAKGYSYSDICVLTRKRKHGILISQGLISCGIPVVSSETLLLQSSPEVNFLINLLRAAHNKEDLDIHYQLLNYLLPKDASFHNSLVMALQDLDNWLKTSWGFDMQWFRFQSVYDGFEEAIKKFGLIDKSDAFVAFLMDEVLTLEHKSNAGAFTFLEHWDKKKDKLSITTPENLDAVKIMTIHKAKGLEFPVVIFPYANTNIYEEIDPKIWLKVAPEKYQGFPEILINKKKQALQYGDQAEKLYTEGQYKLEMDAFNVLYVALTRAIDALFILTEKDLDSKGEHKINYYSGLFIHYLKETGIWDDQKLIYSEGSISPVISDSTSDVDQAYIPYYHTFKVEAAPKMMARGQSLWDTERTVARERGTLIHHVLSLIKYESDIGHVLENLKSRGDLKDEELVELTQLIQQIIHNPNLKPYFNEKLEVRNEQDIITENGLILRPDRLVFDGNQVTVIDYKTGERTIEHREQLISYGLALQKMGYTLSNSLIIYIGDTIKTEIIQ